MESGRCAYADKIIKKTREGLFFVAAYKMAAEHGIIKAGIVGKYTQNFEV